MNGYEENEQERFEVNDLEFCTTCGTILPLPSYDDHLMCRLCKKTIKINGLNLKNLNFYFFSFNKIKQNFRSFYENFFSFARFQLAKFNKVK